MDNQELVRKWHAKYGVPESPTVVMPERERIALRRNLIAEEAREATDVLVAMTLDNVAGKTHAELISELAGELADILVVVYGTAIEFGFDMDDAFRQKMEIVNERMVWDDGEVHRRGDGKVMKNPNYVNPPIQVANASPTTARCECCGITIWAFELPICQTCESIGCGKGDERHA